MSTHSMSSVISPSSAGSNPPSPSLYNEEDTKQRFGDAVDEEMKIKRRVTIPDENPKERQIIVDRYTAGLAFRHSLRLIYLKSFAFQCLGGILALVCQVLPTPWLAYYMIHEGASMRQMTRRTYHQTLYHLCWQDDHLGIPEECGPIDSPSVALVTTRVLIGFGTVLSAISVVCMVVLIRVSWKEEKINLELEEDNDGDETESAQFWKRKAVYSFATGLSAAFTIFFGLFILKAAEGGSGSTSFFICLLSPLALCTGSGLSYFATDFQKYQRRLRALKASKGGNRRKSTLRRFIRHDLA